MLRSAAGAALLRSVPRQSLPPLMDGPRRLFSSSGCAAGSTQPNKLDSYSDLLEHEKRWEEKKKHYQSLFKNFEELNDIMEKKSSQIQELKHQLETKNRCSTQKYRRVKQLGVLISYTCFCPCPHVFG